MNLAVFEGAPIDPVAAIHLLQTQVTEYCVAKDESHLQLGQPPNTAELQRWHKPPAGLVKVNCDAAWSAQPLKGGVGWVIRDTFGLLLGAGGDDDLRSSSALMMEILF